MKNKTDIKTITYKNNTIKYDEANDNLEYIKEVVDAIEDSYGEDEFKKYDFTNPNYIKIDGRKYDFCGDRLTDYMG